MFICQQAPQIFFMQVLPDLLCTVLSEFLEPNVCPHIGQCGISPMHPQSRHTGPVGKQLGYHWKELNLEPKPGYESGFLHHFPAVGPHTGQCPFLGISLPYLEMVC